MGWPVAAPRSDDQVITLRARALDSHDFARRVIVARQEANRINIRRLAGVTCGHSPFPRTSVNDHLKRPANLPARARVGEFPLGQHETLVTLLLDGGSELAGHASGRRIRFQ